MKFWRLTLGFGLLGALILVTYVAVAPSETCSAFDSSSGYCYSWGDAMRFGGVGWASVRD